jgi:hypothetical protein
MRLAYSVLQNRGHVCTGYLSEPLLADAAAQQMYVFLQDNGNAILDILGDILQDGLIDRGERGELMGRELLLLAYDRARAREPKKNVHPIWTLKLNDGRLQRRRISDYLHRRAICPTIC